MKTKFFLPVIAMIALSTVANAAIAKYDEIIRVDNRMTALERRADVDNRVVALERRTDVDARVTAFGRRAEVDARVTAFERRARVDVEFTTPRLTVDVRSQNNVVI